jgi:hypothetical protein
VVDCFGYFSFRWTTSKTLRYVANLLRIEERPLIQTGLKTGQKPFPFNVSNLKTQLLKIPYIGGVKVLQPPLHALDYMKEEKQKAGLLPDLRLMKPQRCLGNYFYFPSDTFS